MIRAILLVIVLNFEFCVSLLTLEMSVKRPRAILYDVDGTISDSFMLGFKATDEVLKSEGYSSITEDTYHQGTRYTTPQRFAWHATGDPEDTSGVGDKLGSLFDDYYVKLVSKDTAPLYDGIDSMLRSLPKDYADLKQGALSNACGAYVQAVMKANNLEDLMGVMKGADEVPEAKPKGGGLLMCSEIINVSPDECVYVGDSPTDGHAAKAAGYYCSVGVTWGSHPAQTVRAAFDYTVSSVSELDTILRQIIQADGMI